MAIGAACAAGLGAIAATVWVGLSVREGTVVAHPYEDGLRQDAERHARAALGLAVWVPGRVEAGAAPLAFELRDRGGPVDDAEVEVEISRPETGRGERAARARSLGGGRWSAELAFPHPGPWDVRFDVARAGSRVRLERRVAATPACDLADGPCTGVLGPGAEVVVELSPRPLRAMRELAVRVRIRQPPLPGPLPLALPGGEGSDAGGTGRTRGPPLPGPLPLALPGGEGSDAGGGSRPHPPLPQAEPGGEGRGEGAGPPAVSLSLSMPGMSMGENRSRLSASGAGTYEGKAVLVRCASGRRDWVAELEVAAPGAPLRTVRFPLTLPEDAR
jgi:nitrogen fixation protein FixH